MTFALILTDFFMALLALMLSIAVRQLFSPIRPFMQLASEYLDLWYLGFLWPIILGGMGLYQGLWLPGDWQLKRVFQSSSIASLVLIALTFLTQKGTIYSRAVVLGLWLFSIPFLASARAIWKWFFTSRAFTGRSAVLIGGKHGCKMVLEKLSSQRPQSFQIAAVFVEREEDVGRKLGQKPIRGTLVEAHEWARQHGIDTAVLSFISLEHQQAKAMLEKVGVGFRYVTVVPDMPDILPSEVSIHDIGGLLSLKWEKKLIEPWRQAIKRWIDLAMTLLISIVALPLGFIIALLILLDSGRPIFFYQERVGRFGERFNALKFRTMVPNAEDILKDLLATDAHARREWDEQQKLSHDPRITRIGHVLRRFSLDELPQFVNIFRGEMSLVGPRPIVASEIERYGETIALYSKVLPGLTGLWQVSGRSTTTYERRVRLDEYYVRHWSIWLDFVIIARTFIVLLNGVGAF